MAAPDIAEVPNREDELQRELARVSYEDFVSYTMPQYRHSAFSREVCAELEQFLEDCIAGLSPRLGLFAPPRHGKTELATRRFSAFAFGKYPHIQWIESSYAESLAARINRDVQRIMEDQPYRNLFPGSRIPSRNTRYDKGKLRNSDIFEIVDDDGSYRASGVGSGITGMGASLFVIDDPVKDAKEANSETTREAIWEWYCSVARTRLEPGAGMLLIMTRWNEDDLAGRLIKASEDGSGEPFKVISYQAIAEQDDNLRKEGEALCPVRFDLKALRALKKAVGTYAWSALYQQAPTAKGGTIFKGDWWKYWTAKAPPRIEWRVITADTAQKKGERNDYTVLQCWGCGEDGRAYLLDQVREKWSAPELLRGAVDFWFKWTPVERRPGPVTREMLIEDKSSGTGLIQQLENGIERDGQIIRIPVRGIPRQIDKATRAHDGAPWIEGGHVVIPDAAPWLSDFQLEFQAFTADDSHSFDDQVDAALDGIFEILGGTGDLYKGAV